MIFISKALAQAPTLEDGQGVPPEVGAGDVLIPNLLLVVAIIGLFVLFVYLPQRRRAKEHNEMLHELRKGDKVVTTGGIVGKIAKQPGETEIVIETADESKITVLRAAITGKYEHIVDSSGSASSDTKNSDAK